MKPAQIPPRIGPLVDTHAHLDDPRLRSDLEGVLVRARESGLVQVLAIGTTATDSGSVVEIAKAHSGVFAAVGVQPNNVAEAGPEDWSRIVSLAGRPRVVALGETGLDRYWDHTPFPQQQLWFDRHLEVARERRLPVVIHCRDCEADVLNQLRQAGPPIRGVMHSFSGNREHAEAFLDLGLFLSFAGMVTFSNKNLDALRDAVLAVPLDRLLIETDSPYLSPHPLRGRPNQPAHLSWTAQYLAKLLQVSCDELGRVTTENAQRLFSLPVDDVI
jgi:TatD DNase family protein